MSSTENKRAHPPTSVIGTKGGEPVSVVMEKEEEKGPSQSAERSAERSQSARDSERAATKRGQRETSMVWELTQMKLALSAMWVALVVSAAVVLAGRMLGLPPEAHQNSAFFLYGIANLIVGFYFGRTNHQRVGGPGGDEAGSR